MGGGGVGGGGVGGESGGESGGAEGEGQQAILASTTWPSSRWISRRPPPCTRSCHGSPGSDVPLIVSAAAASPPVTSQPPAALRPSQKRMRVRFAPAPAEGLSSSAG